MSNHAGNFHLLTKIFLALIFLFFTTAAWPQNSDTTPSFNQTAMSGLFYDPGNPGHGFDINVLNEGIIVYYYGHTFDRQRLWLISDLYTQQISFNSVIELNVYEVADGHFGSPNPPETLWGTLSLEFYDCDTGTALLAGIDGTIDIDLVRLAGIAGLKCFNDGVYLLSGNIQGAPLDLSSTVSTVMSGGIGVTTDGEYLYACGTPIQRMNLSTNVIDELIGSSCFYDLVVDEQYLYYIENLTTIKRRKLDSGEISLVYNSTECSGLSLDENALFVWERSGPSHKVNVDTGQVENLFNSDILRSGITRTHMYVSAWEGVQEIRRDDPNFEFRQIISGRAEGVISDGKYVYATLEVPGPKEIIRIDPVTLEKKTILTGETELRGMATDGTHLYYAKWSTGEIKKIHSNSDDPPQKNVVEEQEYNDEREFATSFPLGGTARGALSDKNDIDWFKVEVSSAETGMVDVHFDVSSMSTGWWSVDWYDPNMEIMSGRNIEVPGFEYAFPAYTPGYYYVRIGITDLDWLYNGGSYEITITKQN